MLWIFSCPSLANLVDAESPIFCTERERMGHPALESIYNVHARMRNSLTAKGLVGLLGIFAGLCTVFALIVSVADKWQEHVQESWPEVTAIVERCSVDPYVLIESARRDPVWHIGCRIGYGADSTQIETRIRSRSTASGWVGRMERMQQWVALHRPGSPIVVHYNPTDQDRRAYRDRHARWGTTDTQQPQAPYDFFGRMPGPVDDCTAPSRRCQHS